MSYLFSNHGTSIYLMKPQTFRVTGLLLGEGGVHPEQVTSVLQGHTTTHTRTPRGN